MFRLKRFPLVAYPPIQLIQHYVWQQWADDSALWRSFDWFSYAFYFWLQYLADNRQYSFILYSHCPYLFQQFSVFYIVKESFYVNVHHIVQSTVIHQVVCSCYCMACCPVRTESVTVVMKVCFTDWFKNLEYTLLNYSVVHTRNTKRSSLIWLPCLWYFHSSDAFRLIVSKFILEVHYKLFFRQSFIILYCFPICPFGFRPTVFLDVSVCHKDVVFVDYLVEQIIELLSFCCMCI